MENILEYLTDKYHSCFRYWWLPMILGIIVIILSLLVFIFPWLSYLTISILFGIVIILSGLFNLAMSGSKSINGKGWLIASGVIELIIGLILAIWPSLSAVSLPYFLGFWLLFKGFTLIGVGSDLSDIKGSGWGWTILWAVLVLICGFIILLYPLIIGVEAVIIWIGVSMLIGGLTLISFSNQLKKGKKE